MISIANVVMDQQVTLRFTLGEVVTWLIVGLIAGFIAALIVRGHGYGIVTNIVIGLIGAFIGGLLASALNIQPPAFLTGGITVQAVSNMGSEAAANGINIGFFTVAVAAVGAAIVLLLLSLIFRRRLRP
jgi:uncharacterized membrane protein YeaQ/YmgE (transglycosylase-associated protein family)